MIEFDYLNLTIIIYLNQNGQRSLIGWLKYFNLSESFLGAEKKEKFDDVICDELKLKEWAFFEHYEDISEGVKSSQYLANLQKVAWFNDIISFWQVWNNLPINDLKNYFYDISTNTF